MKVIARNFSHVVEKAIGSCNPGKLGRTSAKLVACYDELLGGRLALEIAETYQILSS